MTIEVIHDWNVYGNGIWLMSHKPTRIWDSKLCVMVKWHGIQKMDSWKTCSSYISPFGGKQKTCSSRVVSTPTHQPINQPMGLWDIYDAPSHIPRNSRMIIPEYGFTIKRQAINPTRHWMAQRSEQAPFPFWPDEMRLNL